MTLQWLTGAIRKPTHEDGFAWQVACPTKGVLHTTEGFGVPDYPSQYEPHLTVKPAAGKGVAVYQHIPFDRAAYALRHTGAAPTNGAHAIQMELVGTCDAGSVVRKGGGYFWPEADDAVLEDLYRKVIKPISDAFQIPLRAATFLPYPQSGGNTSVRMSDNQWLAFSGWLGHQHVPGNDHGDPGAFPWDRLVAIANRINEEDDMPSLDEIGKLIDAKLAAERANIVSAVLGANLGHSGPNVAVALQSGFVAAKDAADKAGQILTKLGGTPPAA